MPQDVHQLGGIMDPLKPEPLPEYHKADIIFEFIDWCRQRGYTFDLLRTKAEEFKEQYRD